MMATVGPYQEIKSLTNRDVRWLYLLSVGVAVKELPGRKTEQSKKNRLGQIRWFMKCHTTTQAVAEAIRRGLIR